MIMTRLRVKQQRGDTIMEVMICIAILGFVLAAAFALASRNQTSARQSQERSEALQLADSQLELLKTYAGSYKLPAGTHTHFCMKTDASDVIDFPTASGPPVSAVADTDPAKYPDACRRGTDQRYWVAIWSGTSTPQASAAIGAQPGVFGVTVRWDSAGGDIPREETSIFYAVNDVALPTYADVTPPPSPTETVENLSASPAPGGTLVSWDTSTDGASCTITANPGPLNDTIVLNADEGSYPSPLTSAQTYTVTCNGGPPASVAFTPPPACSDGIDNDGDGKSDSADPGCHSDYHAYNTDSYVATDTNETDPTPIDNGCASLCFDLPATGYTFSGGSLRIKARFGLGSSGSFVHRVGEYCVNVTNAVGGAQISSTCFTDIPAYDGIVEKNIDFTIADGTYRINVRKPGSGNEQHIIYVENRRTR